MIGGCFGGISRVLVPRSRGHAVSLSKQSVRIHLQFREDRAYVAMLSRATESERERIKRERERARERERERKTDREGEKKRENEREKEREREHRERQRQCLKKER